MLFAAMEDHAGIALRSVPSDRYRVPWRWSIDERQLSTKSVIQSTQQLRSSELVWLALDA